MQYGSFRDVEAQHLQLTMNARRAPVRVLSDHAENDLTQFLAHALSSRSGPLQREPRPVQLETRPVPPNDSPLLEEDQRSIPSRPEPSQDHPEELVR